MKTAKQKRPHGQMRQSQLVTTFGPGAMIDLPNDSAIIAGLEFWRPLGKPIVEPRLVEKLKTALSVPELSLYAPPADAEDAFGASTSGVTAFRFPEWFVVQAVEKDEGVGSVRSRLLVHSRELKGRHYIGSDRKRRDVVPVRFVRACGAGHIGDIDWYVYVHEGETECRRRLRIEEHGTSGDLSEVVVRCECGKRRNMAQAGIREARALGNCDGSRPWLGPYTKESCGEPSRLLIRTASNAYFTQSISVISLPDRDDKVKQAVDAVWEHLEAVESVEELRYERKKQRVNAALEGLTEEEVWNELKSRKDGTPSETKSVKRAELETLVACVDRTGADDPASTFFATAAPKPLSSPPWMQAIEKVVLVHRLREVSALVGFTRFEALAPDVEGELQFGVSRARISREANWLPAVENRGEGIFLHFSTHAVHEWLARPEVQARARRLLAGFDEWKRERPGVKAEFPGAAYIMLHSFSHLLMSAIALACGYPSSSIRERIYANKDVGYGTLLYTGSADAEGTLGGLVQVGRSLSEHIRAAIAMGELCSNDPVCSQHDPPSAHESRFLHGAACHGCLLASETSCERRNEYLDRAMVIPTLEACGAEFFRERIL